LVGRVLDAPVGFPEVEVFVFELSFAARPVSFTVGDVVVVAPTFAPVLALTDAEEVPAAVSPVVPVLAFFSLGFEHAARAIAHTATATRPALLSLMSLLLGRVS
jgi:hypothetical protein